MTMGNKWSVGGTVQQNNTANKGRLDKVHRSKHGTAVVRAQLLVTLTALVDCFQGQTTDAPGHLLLSKFGSKLQHRNACRAAWFSHSCRCPSSCWLEWKDAMHHQSKIHNKGAATRTLTCTHTVLPPVQLPASSVSPASLKALLAFERSPWRSPIATSRSAAGSRRGRAGAASWGFANGRASGSTTLMDNL